MSITVDPDAWRNLARSYVGVGDVFIIDPTEVFSVFRYEANGTVDSTFGCATPPCPGSVFGPAGYGEDLALQPDGKIIVVGHPNGSNTFQVARYATNGLLDFTFGCAVPPCSGVVNGPGGQGRAIALQTDGKIVVVGPSDTNPGQFRVVRYLANGLLDTSFGCAAPPCSGFATGPGGGTIGPDSVGFGVAIQPDGKIVVASNDGSSPTHPNLRVARYLPSGVLDTTFGCAVAPCAGFVTGPDGLLNSHGIVLQPDGKVIIAGTTTNSGGGQFRVVRYEERGTLDPAFGCSSPPTCSGFVAVPVVGNGGANDLALASDGKIVVAGLITDDYGDNQPTVLRYLNDTTTLSVDKTGPAWVRLGDHVSFEIEVRNTSAFYSGFNVSVQDIPSAGLQDVTIAFVSGAGDWTCTNSNLTCTAPALVANASATFVVTATATQSGHLTNIARVRVSNPAGPQPADAEWTIEVAAPETRAAAHHATTLPFTGGRSAITAGAALLLVAIGVGLAGYATRQSASSSVGQSTG